MDQATMLKSGDLWQHVHQLVKRYNRVREHFQEFANHAAALAGEPAETGGLADNISVTQVVDNYFDVTLMGRTFRFRFSMRAADGSGHISVTEYDRLLKKEIGPKLDDIAFSGEGRTMLRDPADKDPIFINVAIAARYIVLHLIYNALG